MAGASRLVGALRAHRNEWTLFAVLLLAAGLRIHDIDRADVWVDEANTYLTARNPLAVILRMLALDSSPPAYYFALHFWMSIFGDGVVALRALAVCIAVLLTGAVYTVGSRWISSRVGLWAAFLVATSPVQIFYSQQIRMYSLLPLLALLAVWSLVRYLESGELRRLAACWVATVAALYTHNFSLYLLLVLAAVAMLSGQLTARWRAWLASVVVILAGYAPWVRILLRQMANADHYAWYLPLWEVDGVWGVIGNTFKSYSPAGEFAMFEYRGAPDLGGWPAAGLAALAALGLFQLIRRRGDLGPVGWPWVPVFLVLPMISSIGVSALLTPHYVPGRVDQMMYPAYALLAANGITSLRPIAARSAVAIAVLILGVLTKSIFYTDYRDYRSRGSDRALALAVRERLRPGDVVLCTSLTRASLEYYLRDEAATILSYPRETARHLGAQNDRRLLEDLGALRREAQIALDAARSSAGADGRLFLLRSRLSVNDPLSRDSLNLFYGVTELENLGRYIETGTEDVIWLTINRLRLSSTSGEGGSW